MARVRIEIYKHSGLATVIGALGKIYIYAGVLIPISALFSGEMKWSEGLICLLSFALFGFLHLKAAKSINEKAQLRKLKKSIRENGIEQQLTGSVEMAVQLFETYPTKPVKKYISRLNPQAGEIIAARGKRQK